MICEGSAREKNEMHIALAPILNKRMARLVIAITTLVFLVLSLISACYSPIEYDEAYNASVAKNFELGLGYATSYGEFIPFNPEITTGPGLLLPIAAMIKLWGNQYWVPGATNALLSCPLFGLLFIFLSSPVEDSLLTVTQRISLIFALPLFLLLCWGSGVIGFFSVGLGETGATGFIILGQFTLAIATVQSNPLRILVFTMIGGFLLGFSLYYKAIVLLQIIPTLVLFWIITTEKMGRLLGLRYLFLLFASILLFPLIFYIVSAPYFNFKTQFDFFVYHGSGFNYINIGFRENLHRILVRICANFEIIFKTLIHGISACFFAMAIINGIIGIGQRSRQRVPTELAAHVFSDAMRICFLYVLVGAFGGFSWWLCFSDTGNIRHLLPFFLALLLLISISPFFSSSRWTLTSLICIVIGIVIQYSTYSTRLAGIPAGYLFHPSPPSNTSIIKTYSGFRLEPSHRIMEQIAICTYLSALKRSEPEAQFYGCGWWAVRDIEYLLPSANNFKNIDNSSFTKRLLPGKRYLVVDQQYWINWGDIASNRANSEWCKPNNLIFSTGDYQVYLCP